MDTMQSLPLLWVTLRVIMDTFNHLDPEQGGVSYLEDGLIQSPHVPKVIKLTYFIPHYD